VQVSIPVGVLAAVLLCGASPSLVRAGPEPGGETQPPAAAAGRPVPTTAAVGAQAGGPTHTPCAGLYVTSAVLSDYRFDGFSQSNRGPTWQVLAHCYRDDGFYAGSLITGVNFGDTPRTTLELDLYAGRHFAVWGSDLNLEVLYTAFNKRTPGPTYNLIEPEAELSHVFKRLTLKVQVAWSPNDSNNTGQLWHLKATGAYAVMNWLTVSARLGRIWIARGQDRFHGDVGATATWRRLSFDVRYAGTNLKRSQCYFTDWCAPGGAVTLTYRLLP
jgi:uncharacterized protein (TIGR02001 family)